MKVGIVGGGIVGLASAFYLAERGATVTVYEKGSLGNGSTERSAGGIRGQFSTPVNVDLSVASMDAWETFERDFDADVAYRRPGYLFVTREAETARAFEDQVTMQNDRGVPSELLDPEAAAERCPGLRTENLAAATYSPTDGFADPHLALQAFADAAREAGAEIRTGTPVETVHRKDEARRASERRAGRNDPRDAGGSGGVAGLTADGNRADYDFVINAAGPWARRVARMADVEIPVAPRRRQVLVVEPETPVPEDVPLTIDLDTGAYFRPEREGAALVGGHFPSEDRDPDQDPDGFDRSFDLDWAGEALERAADLADYFGPDARIRRGWAGLYAVTPDHHPIVEETVPGFVQAVGFSGHGFQHAPATGRLVAELVLDGEASLVDISALGSERFADGDLVAEQNVA